MLDWRTWGLSVAVAWSLAPAVRADVFHLANGGDVRGEVLNPDESPRSNYVIKTAQGGKISLPAGQVEKVDKQSGKEIEYDRHAAVAPDTVKGQWDVAEFCRENNLISQRKKHLERIIQLDPEHVEARHALGYSRIKGQWSTVEAGMDAQGRKLYKNVWRLPQEIELMERAHKEDLAQKEWFRKLKQWRGWFHGDKSELARAHIGDINDPLAVKALTFYLDHEDRRDLKMLWISALARIGGAALDPLVAASLADGDEEVRIACLERLQAAEYKPAVSHYIAMLKHKDNATVNLAGVGLYYMKDPSATRALIDALVTTHKYTLQPAS
ncbi:MAG TPA: HEAT repeat domain-containing protein, partial [Pirellulales bacterium]